MTRLNSMTRLTAITVALFVALTPSFGQTGTSAITGTVVDGSNSVVPGATARLTYAATGAVRTTTSNDAGQTWSAAKKVGNETWKIDACPMDGGGLTLTGQARPYAVFRKEKEIHYSTPGAIERMLGEGKDPAIASGLDESLYVVWTSPTGAIESMNSKENKVRVLAPKGAYPQVVFTGHQALAFWEEEDGIGMGVVEGRPPMNRSVKQ